jgi:hypothetical protein
VAGVPERALARLRREGQGLLAADA